MNNFVKAIRLVSISTNNFVTAIFRAVLLLTVSVYLAWLTGNLRDEAVAPEIVEILSKPAERTLSHSENAFYRFIGIRASENTEPNAWGQAWVNQAREINTARAQILRSPEYPAIINDARPSVSTATQIPCHEIAGCLERVGATPETTRQILQAEAVLLQRFDALLNLAYREPYMGPIDSVGSPHIPYPGLIPRLAENRIALWLVEGKHTEAIEQLRKEAHFFHAMLEGSRTLIGKMVATRSLHRRHQLIAQFIGLHPQIARVHAARISMALLEPSDRDLSLREALESELIGSYNFMKFFAASGFVDLSVNLPEESSLQLGRQIIGAIFAPFFKPIATSNERSQWYLAWIRVDDSRREGYAHYRSQLAQLRNGLHPQAERSWMCLLRYRNPIGKCINQDGPPDLGTYFFRRDNLIADRLLIQHALDAIGGKVALNPNTPHSDQDHLLHPFTGQPPVWDKTRRELRFERPGDLKGSDPDPPLVVRFPATQ